jgi:hypothetical protein
VLLGFLGGWSEGHAAVSEVTPFTSGHDPFPNTPSPAAYTPSKPRAKVVLFYNCHRDVSKPRQLTAGLRLAHSQKLIEPTSRRKCYGNRCCGRSASG